jgi:hypothetical protein
MPRIPIPLEDERGRERILGLIKALDVTKPWQVTIEPKTKKRTLNQNALYWKWVGLIADATGNDNDDVHEALKAKFLTPRTIDLGGEQREIRSTAKQGQGWHDGIHGSGFTHSQRRNSGSTFRRPKNLAGSHDPPPPQAPEDERAGVLPYRKSGSLAVDTRLQVCHGLLGLCGGYRGGAYSERHGRRHGPGSHDPEGTDSADR